MSMPNGYYRFLNSLNWDNHKNVKLKINIDSRLHYLLKEEAKLGNESMNQLLNDLIARWVIRRIKERGCIVVEKPKVNH